MRPYSSFFSKAIKLLCKKNGEQQQRMFVRWFRSTGRKKTREPVGLKEWQKTEKDSGYILLVVPAAAFALGCWQVQRRSWKLGLIQELESRTSAPPVPFPYDLTEVQDLEYKKVKVRGEFDHSKEIYIMPRVSIGDRKLSGLKGHDNGAHVITPFRMTDRNLTILVNRGWVPREHLDPSSRKQGQIEGEIDLCGVVRLTEQRQPFGAANMPDKNQWFHRDIDEISSYLGTDPYFIDAVKESTVAGGPLGGQTRISLRNEHMSYIFTWYSLAAFTGLMWWRRYGPSLAKLAR